MNFFRVNRFLRHYGYFLLFFILLCFLLYDHFKFLLHEDMTSFYMIAKEYASGDFYTAINSCWPPLFSWLLIPFIKLGLSPLHAIQSLSFIISISGLFLVLKFNQRWQLEHMISISIGISATVIFVYFFLCGSGLADTLMVLIIVFLFYQLIYPTFKNGYIQEVLIGIIGGFGFLCKAYFFWVFIIYSTVLFIFRLRLNANKEIKIQHCKLFITSFLSFIFISGIWIALISFKTNQFNLSPNGDFNLSQTYTNLKYTTPWKNGGLYPLPNKTAVHIHEDLTSIKFEHFNPFSNLTNLIRVVKNTCHNFVKLIFSFNTYNSFLIVSILILTCYLIFSDEKIKSKIHIFILISFVFCYPLGYLLLFFSHRHFYIFLIFPLFFTGIITTMLYNHIDNRLKTFLFKFIIALSVLISSLLFPLQELWSEEKNAQSDKIIQAISNEVLTNNISGNIASDSNWEYTLYVAFFSNLKYNGILKFDSSYQEKKRDSVFVSSLNKYNVKYFFSWKKDNDYLRIFGKEKQIEINSFPNLVIYKID